MKPGVPVKGSRVSVLWPLVNGSQTEFTATVAHVWEKAPRRKRSRESECKFLLKWEDGSTPCWSRLLHLQYTVLTPAASDEPEKASKRLKKPLPAAGDAPEGAAETGTGGAAAGEEAELQRGVSSGHQKKHEAAAAASTTVDAASNFAPITSTPLLQPANGQGGSSRQDDGGSRSRVSPRSSPTCLADILNDDDLDLANEAWPVVAWEPVTVPESPWWWRCPSR